MATRNYKWQPSPWYNSIFGRISPKQQSHSSRKRKRQRERDKETERVKETGRDIHKDRQRETEADKETERMIEGERRP